MIYPEVSLNEWIKKWDLEIVKYDCPKCREVFETTVPVMTRQSAGLQSPIHGCGSELWTVILTPRTAESLAFWDTIV